MSIVERRSQDAAGSDRVNVITNAVLLSRRIRELQRRRQGLVAQQEQLRAQLPDWALEPLRLVGMTTEEIRSLVNEWSVAEAESGLDTIEQQLDEVDRQIEDLEKVLAGTASASLDEIEAVLSLAVTRFREIFATNPDDVFYDHGEARLLALIERVHEDLAGFLSRGQTDAG